MNKFAAIIYDKMNIIVRVEERPTRERAEMAGRFFTRRTGWYKIAQGAEDIEMYKAIINL